MGAVINSRRIPHALSSLLLAFLLCALIACSPFAAFADEEHSDVAGSGEMARVEELGDASMVPISGMDVKDGTYPIEAESSSSFFKIVDAQLTVADGQMTAQIVLRSKSYLLAYMGTGQEAAAAPASDYIPFDEETMSFTIPVEALDANLSCAAFSKNREKWYDRTIMFYANSLPEGALLVEANDYEASSAAESSQPAASEEEAEESSARTATGAQPVPLDLTDGEYSIEVNMTGGSGRASVSSPTWLVVKDGRAWARLLWSSSYYDYMIVDGVTYPNETDDGSN